MQTQKIQNQTQSQKVQNQMQTQKIQNQTQHTHNTNTPRKFKIKHNKLTIQTQRAPKSNTNPNLTLNPFKEQKSTSS